MTFFVPCNKLSPSLECADILFVRGMCNGWFEPYPLHRMGHPPTRIQVRIHNVSIIRSMHVCSTRIRMHRSGFLPIPTYKARGAPTSDTYDCFPQPPTLSVLVPTTVWIEFLGKGVGKGGRDRGIGKSKGQSVGIDVVGRVANDR
eukprot:scaffold519_cov331-Pavlova_lutheri.AAC.15